VYEQCMDLQLYYRDTEQADAWMAKQEVIYVFHAISMFSYIIYIVYLNSFRILAIFNYFYLL